MRDGVEPLVVPGEDARPEFVACVWRDLAVVVARDGAEEHVVGALGGGIRPEFGFGFVFVDVDVRVGVRVGDGVGHGCRYGHGG